MADYQFIAYYKNGGSIESGFVYKTYKEVFAVAKETIMPMDNITKVEITCDGKKIEELTKDEEMTEKIIISK